MDALRVGCRVRVRLARGDQDGTVIELRPGQCRCELEGGLKVWVDVSTVEVLSVPEEPGPSPSSDAKAPVADQAQPEAVQMPLAARRRRAGLLLAWSALCAVALAVGGVFMARGDQSPEHEAVKEQDELAVPPLSETVTLPTAQNGTEIRRDAPAVLINQKGVYVDGIEAGDLQAVLAKKRVVKIEELSNLLKAKRQLWTMVNPNKVFFGNIIFWIDARTPALVVKSALQTAAFAGFPLVTFVVKDQATSKLVVFDTIANVPAEVLAKDEPVQFDNHGRIVTQIAFKAGELREGPLEVQGTLTTEVVVQRVSRQVYHTWIRPCYERGLHRNATLSGRITVRFIVDRDGKATNVTTDGSNLPDDEVISCVVRAFRAVAFPKPVGGTVTVTYPIDFRPADTTGH